MGCLFILEEELKEIKKAALVIQCEGYSNSKDELMLWHLRVGHPSFPNLKMLFLLYLIIMMLQIFHMKLVNSLNITKSSFLHKFNSSLLFFCINDIWGPSHVNNVCSASIVYHFHILSIV